MSRSCIASFTLLISSTGVFAVCEGAAKVATSGAAKEIAESGHPESFGLHGQVDEAGFYALVMANRRTEAPA